MRYLIALLLVVLISSYPDTGRAQTGTTGNELLNNCTSKTPMWKTFCLGYVAGIRDALPRNIACIPKAVTIGQLQDIVLKYLREHPESRHRGRYPLVVRAYREAFPCAR